MVIHISEMEIIFARRGMEVCDGYHRTELREALGG